MQDFVHLHVHTEYSLLDGANRIKDLIKKTIDLGMKSIAITDHGVMYGVIDFYKQALANGLKPIIGCEVYTAKRTRFDKESGTDAHYGHLILLAKDNIGYKNLMKLVSAGFTEGFYYKPRIDFDILKKHSEGLIAFSACLSGDIPKAILSNNFEKAKSLALFFQETFGEGNFYLELQHNGIPEQNLVNQKLIELSKELSIPLVATNDAHYLNKKDAKAHEILLCIQTGKNMDDEDHMKFSSSDFYIKSPDEMWEMFKEVPEAYHNTVKIAEECNVNFEFGKLYLPSYDVPDEKDSFEYLSELCMQGMMHKYGETLEQNKINRLNFELSIIKQMNFIDYFLIVWDFIKYAKDHGIMVGPGRGSAAGSIVAYSLGITNVDPLKYNLLFERFLNPERISMPDIDIDFCYERRQEVIDYVVRKYGKDRVAQIITFGTMAARAAIRDVGRALNIPYTEVDAVAKMIPFQIGINIEKALEMSPELKKKYDDDARIRELIDTALLLEGMPRHASTHAAGVVISKEPITEYVPLYRNEDSITTQFTMGLLEELGLLKMDFLGLRTLTVIRDAVELVLQNEGVKIDMDNLEFEDPNVYKIIGEGKTAGIFQLESNGMTQFMKELKPSTLEDIIAGISLYRPGPMDQIPRYIKNKNNPKGVTYEHPILEKILDVTYGCMVYQEQVMQIVRDLAGYSMGRSDLVRRAMSKKKAKVMEEERQNFVHGIVSEDGIISVAGAVRNGVTEKVANKIFDEMMDFASYAFNKSHAAAYAVIGYQTAYLKYYYPVAFMAALLNSFLGSSEKISVYIVECKGMGIEILPTDINESFVKFTPFESKIRFGLAAVKNVGEGAVKSIIVERQQNGLFKDFRDFLTRMDGKEINKRCIESLIKCGAFDSFKVYRARMLAVFEKVMDGIANTRKKNMAGQMSFFDLGGGEKLETESISFPDIQEYPSKILLTMEKEMLGLYVSGHPLSEFENEFRERVTVFSSDLMAYASDESENIEDRNSKNIYDGMSVKVGGIIASKKLKTTKNNNTMAFIMLEDLFGTMEVIVFPTILSQNIGLFMEENIVLIRGRLSIKEEEIPKIICEDIEPLKKAKIKKLYLKTNPIKSEEGMTSLLALLRYFNGNIPVYLHQSEEKKTTLTEKECWVSVNDCLIGELVERLGLDGVKLLE